jgi:hypothetical protein
LSELRCRVNVVLLAFRPEPPLLSAALPLKLAGTVAARKALPFAGAVTDAVIGAVLSKVKVTVLVPVFPTVSVAVTCTVYVASTCEDHVGSVALFVHVAAVLLVVALCVVARLTAAACQAEPVQ